MEKIKTSVAFTKECKKYTNFLIPNYEKAHCDWWTPQIQMGRIFTTETWISSYIAIILM